MRSSNFRPADEWISNPNGAENSNLVSLSLNLIQLKADNAKQEFFWPLNSNGESFLRLIWAFNDEND